MKRINRITTNRVDKQHFTGVELKIGERLETFCERLESTQQDIPCERELFYQEDADELLPDTDIRTDKWLLAQRALDKLHNTKREQSEKLKKEGLQNSVEEDLKDNNNSPTDN